MTPGRMRRVGDAQFAAYQASGSLDGLAAGRRLVKQLDVSRVDGATAEEGLDPLLRFPDLERLELNRLASVSLEPLTQVELEHLRIWPGRDLDLAPLSRVATRSLMLIDLDDRCRVPERLVLHPSLELLLIVADHVNASPRMVKRLIEAVDWRRAGGLRTLGLRVGGLTSLPPIETDLSFLGHLQRLERLDMEEGIWHLGPKPSPLEPPFDRLPSRSPGCGSTPGNRSRSSSP